jgi:WD40 repeat protein
VKSKKLKVKKFDLSFASRVSDSTWQNSLHRIQSCKFKIQETLFIAISVTSNDLHIYRESDMQLHQSIRIEGEFDIKSITLFKDTLKEVKSTYLACACSDHVIRIVDLCNTSQVTCLGLELNLNASKGHTDSVNAITYFKRKEKPYLATAGADGTIRIWNLNKLSTIFIFRGHSNTITSLRYIPGYRLLLSTSLDSSMRLWSVEFWSCVKIMSCFDDDELNCCEFTVSVNHLSLYTAGAKGLIYMIQFDLSSAGRSSSMQVVQPDKMCKVS